MKSGLRKNHKDGKQKIYFITKGTTKRALRID
jgi:hypothetical protein